MNTPMPTLFLSHGSPRRALEPGLAGAFMQRLGPTLDRCFGRPRAILVVSAHTLARRTVLLAAARHQAVYDFGGFDPRLRQLRYDAPGAPALADQVFSLLEAAGHAPVRVDQGGLDHGIWTPLRYLYPDADVPVLPLAFDPYSSPARLFDLGRALAPLTSQGVLVLGSGSLLHNLQLAYEARSTLPSDAPELPECAAFREWVRQHAESGDVPALLDYRRQAPHAELWHPTDEHWLPWYPAQGAAGSSEALRVHDSLNHGCLPADAYAFGPAAPALQAALAETGTL